MTASKREQETARRQFEVNHWFCKLTYSLIFSSSDLFQELTEAYQTLMDATQRHFYDRHGFTCEGLKKKGLPTIFDYKPK
jgi:hypothetical protein